MTPERLDYVTKMIEAHTVEHPTVVPTCHLCMAVELRQHIADMEKPAPAPEQPVQEIPPEEIP